MAELLPKLREMVDLVIIDSPPVQAVADPLVLAARVDGVVLVVDAGKTARETLRRTVDALGRVGVHLVGVVLNRQTTPLNGYKYGYYGTPEPATPEVEQKRSPLPDLASALPALPTRATSP
jgi:Mrp family chromosome partitioning ATPase